MAYTPVNWQTGDTITAERLNRMDRGWDVETTELFSETVTAAADPDYPEYPAIADLAYTGTDTPDELIVTFDGTEYQLSYRHGYGDDTLEATPFYLGINPKARFVATKTAGTHAIAARTVPALQTSADFDTARGWGYAVTELFSETVTANSEGSATLAYSGTEVPAELTVTLDGTAYDVKSATTDTEYVYIDSSDFSFEVNTANGTWMLEYVTEGQHTISASAALPTAHDELRKAIKTVADEAAGEALASVSASFIVTIGTTTWAQVNSALKAGRPAFVWSHTTVNKQPDYYEFVATALYDSWTVYTLAVSSGAVVVNTYQATSQAGVLTKVTS